MHIQKEDGNDANVSMEIRIATYAARFNGPESEPERRTISGRYTDSGDDRPPVLEAAESYCDFL